MTDLVKKNKYGEVVLMSHTGGEQPDISFDGATPMQIADKYIEEKLAEMSLLQSRLASDNEALQNKNRSDDPILSVMNEKKLMGATTVVYQQSLMGMPVFNARIGVTINDANNIVMAMQSSAHANIKIANPKALNADSDGKKMSADKIKSEFGISLSKMKDARVNQQLVYRFEADERTEHEEDHEGCFGGHAHKTVKLEKLPSKIEEGQHYIVDEVLFKAPVAKGEGPVNWRALVEPQSGVVLYIRALVGGATAMVYEKDPQTQSGSSVTGASPAASLDPFRSSVTLPGLVANTPQDLSGEFVEIVDLSAPTVAPPTGASPASALNFSVPTDHFSAVNAYYHCDNLFRVMQDFGFNISSYFSGTSFPVPIDHRGKGSAVNADCPGDGTGDGIGMMRYGLLQSGTSVGIATSNRVVLHEFGHGLLWDNVSSPNFGFAHSAGDALAAIHNDPGSNEPDTGMTFPWVTESNPGVDRRHDRTPPGGWAWFGPNWNTQYGGEQVLSSTLFRLYQSLGGASSNLNKKETASDLTTYLIYKGIGLLSSTSSIPETFEVAMENADLTTANFQGIPGGAVHKVVRWAFEKQGLFQPSAAPGMGNNVMTEGNPPDVDVYIDDGRNGEYDYLANHWSCQDMWVRNAPDGGLTHQAPIVGVPNFMYVRVKNRGSLTANNVSVDAYHCLPGTGLSFPDDWIAMTTATLPASGPIASGGDDIVGPFDWVPTQVGHECLLAVSSADGDPANDTTIMGTVPESRLVPHDNNIGQRNVNPVMPEFKFIAELFRKHPFWVRNPFRKSVVCEIKITLPRFLAKLGWRLHVRSAGGQKFEMGPRARRQVILVMEPGKEFSRDIAKRSIARGDSTIMIETFLNGERSGGMTYPLSFDARKAPVKEFPQIDRSKVGQSTIEEILKILQRKDISNIDNRVGGRLGNNSIRTIRMEFDLDEDE